MRTTFCRFDKGLFMRPIVIPMSIISYLIMVAHKIFSNFRGSFPKVQRYAIIWFLIFNCGLLVRVLLLFEKVQFLWHNLFFNPGWWTTFGCYYCLREYYQKFENWYYYTKLWTTYMDVSLVLEDFFSRSRIPPII